MAIIGRLSPEKGHAVLFRALPRVIQEKPSLKCLVIGEGPLRPDLVRLAETLGISDNVIFMGYQKAIGAILSRVDLVIAPSLQEGCPLSLIEAMACGKMIVASDVPGIREVTEGYEPVFLAPPRESRTLADAILKGLASRRKEEEEGSSPRGMLPDRFSSEKMVEAYLKVYEELLMAPPPSVK